MLVTGSLGMPTLPSVTTMLDIGQVSGGFSRVRTPRVEVAELGEVVGELAQKVPAVGIELETGAVDDDGSGLAGGVDVVGPMRQTRLTGWA